MSVQTSSDADANGAMSNPGDSNGSPTSRTKAKRRYSVTEKVRAAHRANAKNSTGPRSEAGKQHSRRNALKHGLTAFNIPILVWGEDATAYNELYQKVRQDYPPLDVTGEWAVRRLTNAFWNSRRLDQAEWALLTQEPHRQSNVPKPPPLPGSDSTLLTEKPHHKSDVPFRWEPGFAKLYLNLFYPGLLEKASEPTLRLENTNKEFWVELHMAAQCLGHVIPEIGEFLFPEPADATLDRLRDAVVRMQDRVKREFPDACLRERAWEMVQINACLVPAEPKVELLIRYAAMIERKILFYLRLIADHCGRRA